MTTEQKDRLSSVFAGAFLLWAGIWGFLHMLTHFSRGEWPPTGLLFLVACGVLFGRGLLLLSRGTEP